MTWKYLWFTGWNLFVQSQQWKQQNNVWNLSSKLKVRTPEGRPSSTSHRYLDFWFWIDFINCHGVSFVTFEQVNVPSRISNCIKSKFGYDCVVPYFLDWRLGYSVSNTLWDFLIYCVVSVGKICVTEGWKITKYQKRW